jgi:hypothetical protein
MLRRIVSGDGPAESLHTPAEPIRIGIDPGDQFLIEHSELVFHVLASSFLASVYIEADNREKVEKKIKNISIWKEGQQGSGIRQ